ncbi:DoxX family protein [Glycomyces arizonensis]|uniref:DoxX family protein n=1 Tax=Glycomyces arizonensis TaxID=256035 RepID=UPI00040E1CDB|nr:DoxX family protein [Glycomyces arizonensis]
MSTFFIVIAALAAVFNLGSGIGSMARLKVIYPLLDGVRVPRSWLVFPIGVLKAAGGLGLAAGLLGAESIGTAAAVGLVLFWVCALYTHALANFWPKETFLAGAFLALAVGTLSLDLLV